MNRKPTMIRPLVSALLASGLLLASTGASADHRRHSHSNDVAEGLLAGALAVLTIGIIIDGVDGWHGQGHYHYRPDSYLPHWKHRPGPRHYRWDHRHRKGPWHWKGHRHWKRHHHGYGHRPYRTKHRRADRGWDDSRPSHDRGHHDRQGWHRTH